jgi:hypothetical protein
MDNIIEENIVMDTLDAMYSKNGSNDFNNNMLNNRYLSVVIRINLDDNYLPDICYRIINEIIKLHNNLINNINNNPNNSFYVENIKHKTNLLIDHKKKTLLKIVNLSYCKYNHLIFRKIIEMNQMLNF